jgi:hypothetical protein
MNAEKQNHSFTKENSRCFGSLHFKQIISQYFFFALHQLLKVHLFENYNF